MESGCIGPDPECSTMINRYDDVAIFEAVANPLDLNFLPAISRAMAGAYNVGPGGAKGA